jgi:unconventional prefoldin RPB5 interactor 1
VEILTRREQGLESQAESLKVMMRDLQAEASFFGATASEAAVRLSLTDFCCSFRY